MDISNAQRARVLVHALPYIQDYSGKIVVVKYGGNAMVSEHLKDSVIRDICLLQLIGVKVVLVHGGGPEITETLGKMGKKSAFVDGVRVTDEEAVGVALMVLAGKINKTLVNLIELKGGSAIGLSGLYDVRRFLGNAADDLVLRNAPLAYLAEDGLVDKKLLAKAEENALLLCAGQGSYEGDALVDTQAMADALTDCGLPVHLEVWGSDVSHDWYWWGKELNLFAARVFG
jgi:hypothetical protein